jgi:methyl coenzyme M reductase subunit C-like uncharacterized protein (methanogenesis marker protein 7)
MQVDTVRRQLATDASAVAPMRAQGSINRNLTMQLSVLIEGAIRTQRQ